MGRIKKFGKQRFKGNQYTLRKYIKSHSTPNTSLEKQPASCISGLIRTPSVSSKFSGTDSNAPSLASKRKLRYLDTCAEDSFYVPSENNSGNIIVDLSTLNEQILKNVKCAKCLSDSLELFENADNRKGLACKLSLVCKSCEYSHSFYSSKKTDANFFDVNLRCVYGFRSIGKGRQGAAVFCAVMNLPKPPSRFQTYTPHISKFVQEVAKESMVEAANEARIENGNNDEISAAFDGTWQRRGHISLNGVFTVTSVDTGKILDLECLSKYCPKCKTKKNLAGQHKCLKNYEGPSGGMETAGALEIFKRSVEFLGVKYTKYLGDGDSKAFEDVAAIKPYGDVKITKLECVGHIQKRMGGRLRRLTQDLKGKKLSDGKILTGRGRLTKVAMNLLQTYFGVAIRSNLHDVEAMRKAVWATFFHKLSTDQNPQHGLCPKGADSWCKYHAAEATNQTYVHKNALPAAVMQEIKPIYTALSDTKLLSKCLHGRTQNPNECFNMIIWSRVPKNVFVGLDILKLGAYDAVISYNTGDLGKIKVLDRMCGSAGTNAVIGLKYIDNTRVVKAEKAMTEVAKKARVTRRNIKKKKQDKEEEKCETKYGPGIASIQ